MAGKGEAQRLQRDLQPAWASVRIDSQPPGARVQVDGEEIGVTPLETELLQGERQVVLTLDKYQQLALPVQVRAGHDLALDTFQLQPADGRLLLDSNPAGASVSIDGVTRELPEPFLVLATQNPVESQGTYPLPEAQLDRFLLKVDVRHPTKKTEQQILENYLQGFDPADLERVGLKTVLSVEQLLEMQRYLGQVKVEAGIVEYVTDIVTRTRVHPMVYLGASPRGSVALLVTSRALAASQGRDFVIPDDVKSMAPAVLRHRLLLHPDAELEGLTPDDCIESVLREATVPKTAA